MQDLIYKKIFFTSIFKKVIVVNAINYHSFYERSYKCLIIVPFEWWYVSKIFKNVQLFLIFLLYRVKFFELELCCLCFIIHLKYTWYYDKKWLHSLGSKMSIYWQAVSSQRRANKTRRRFHLGLWRRCSKNPQQPRL